MGGRRGSIFSWRSWEPALEVEELAVATLEKRIGEKRRREVDVGRSTNA